MGEGPMKESMKIFLPSLGNTAKIAQWDQKLVVCKNKWWLYKRCNSMIKAANQRIRDELSFKKGTLHREEQALNLHRKLLE